MTRGDILAEIDAAIGCQRCGRSLDASPSPDFCSEICQYFWHKRRADRSGLPDREALRESVGLLQQLSETFNNLAAAIAPLAKSLRDAGLMPNDLPEDPKTRALHMQRHRNTGPQDHRTTVGRRVRSTRRGLGADVGVPACPHHAAIRLRPIPLV